jgi:hypothetical protein
MPSERGEPLFDSHSCDMPRRGWLYRCPICDRTWRLVTRSSSLHGSTIWTQTRGPLRWLTRPQCIRATTWSELLDGRPPRGHV